MSTDTPNTESRSTGTTPAAAFDVVVIGAGVTGLTAAYDLRRQGKSVAVIEVRDRVGGRLKNETLGDYEFEVGGQWIAPDQTAALALAEELGLVTFQRFREGNSVYIDRAGTRTEYTGDDYSSDKETTAAIAAATDAFAALVDEVDADEPWAHPRAAELDAITFAQWIAGVTDNIEARDNLAMFVGAAFLTKPATTFSALQAALMAASAGGAKNLIDPDFVLDRRVSGGLRSIPFRLAEELGDVVALNERVRQIEVTAGTDAAGTEGASAVVTVSTDVRTVTARAVLLALPYTLVPRIDFVPPLPTVQQQMHQHYSFGSVIKVQAVYSTPFWRAAGLSGSGYSPYQFAHEIYDNTPEGVDYGVLVSFVADENADAALRMDAADRRSRILSSWATYFGDEALTPVEYHETDWESEEWTRGAYAASIGMGGLARYGAAIHASVGPIFFGSSDIAGHGYQHVDGGIRVGQRRAREIAELLG